jgi:hypothetical protein
MAQPIFRALRAAHLHQTESRNTTDLCKLHNLTLLKTFFTNKPVKKHILDLDPLKDIKPVDVLIELRDVKGFGVFPSTSERAEIEGR